MGVEHKVEVVVDVHVVTFDHRPQRDAEGDVDGKVWGIRNSTVPTLCFKDEPKRSELHPTR